MMKRGLPQVDKYKVVVLSITYNHSQYIEDTLNGFVIQQTNFPFLCCVFDDASTDGEQDVLKLWINSHCNPDEVEIYDHPLTVILMAPDKNNPNCIYAIHLQKVNTFGKPEKRELINYWNQYGEYIAMCEGDDYWTDSLKLQKQVDFLDNNPNYSSCAHQSLKIGAENGLFYENVPSEITMEMLLSKSRLFHTASLIFRAAPFLALPEIKENILSGDKLLFLKCSTFGPIKYYNDIMCVYRKHIGGVSSSVRYKDIIKDKNIIPYMKGIYPNFPKYRYLSFLYSTFALFCCDITLIQRIWFLFVSLFLSFSYFPYNIKEIGQKIIRYAK